MDNKKIARESRGEVSDEYIEDFMYLLEDDLIDNLRETNPRVRSASAVVLGRRRSLKSVAPLCESLKKEKSLYSKIAISNALGEIGLPALESLLKLVGRIGDNQHHKLPSNIFKKWNYPCPRDITIRTIIKIGENALPQILSQLQITDDRIVLIELVDAIGYISFYSENRIANKPLFNLLNIYKGDSLLEWKIIRAFQCFNTEDVLNYLCRVLEESIVPQLRWEAIRSLGQIGSKRSLNIIASHSDDYEKVNEMINLSLQKNSWTKESN